MTTNYLKKNSITLDLAFKKWEKEQDTAKNNNNNNTNIRPVLTNSRRNSLPSVDKDGFILPRKTTKGKSIENTPEAPLDTSNQFEHLNNIETATPNDNNNAMESDQVETMTHTHSQQNTQEFQQAGTSSQTIDPENLKTFKPPPIFVTGEKVNDSIKTLKNAGLPQDSFSVSISKGLHSIQVMKQIDYDKVKLALKSNQIQFYSFTPKGEKLKSILLKGVSEEYTSDQVLEDLLNRNIPSVEIKKVTELKFVHDNQERRHLIVQITQRSSLKELFKIKNVLHMKTRWERLRRNKLLQCRRCQRIGHTAANCEMLFRCVKCGETHEPGKCPLNTATSRENFKCANCGKSGHPANYAGCKYIKFAHLSKKAELQSRNKSLAKKIDQVTGNYFSPRQFSNTAAQQKDAFPPLPSRNQANGIIQRSQPSPWQTPPPIGGNAQPDWLAQIKNEICSLTNVVREMSVTINHSIQSNTRKIDFIFGFLNLQHEY